MKIILLLLSTISLFAQNKQGAIDWLINSHDGYIASKYYSYSSHPDHRGKSGRSGLANGTLKQVLFDSNAVHLNQEAYKTYPKAEISIQWADIEEVETMERYHGVMIRAKKGVFIFLDVKAGLRSLVIPMLEYMAISSGATLAEGSLFDD